MQNYEDEDDQLEKWKDLKLPIVKNVSKKEVDFISIEPAPYNPNSKYKMEYRYPGDEKTIEEKIYNRIPSKYCNHLAVGDLVYIDREKLLNIDKTGLLARHFLSMINKVGTVTSCKKLGHCFVYGWVWEAVVSYETVMHDGLIKHTNDITCKTGIFTKVIKD